MGYSCGSHSKNTTLAASATNKSYLCNNAAGNYWNESVNTEIVATDDVTVTLTWHPDAGQNDPPPPTLTLKETSHSQSDAGYNGPGTPTASDGWAEDGLGDPAVFSSTNAFGKSMGSHLITVDSHTGVVMLHHTLLAQTPSNFWITETDPNDPDYEYSYWLWMPTSYEYFYNVTHDTRAATISCPAVDIDLSGGSKYREPALTGPIITNVRQPDGTLRGDTVAPLSVSTFEYSANVAGTWSPSGTTWHWYSSPISNTGTSGDYPSVPVFDDTYAYGTATGNSEHIYLSLYDGQDQAKAAGNYDMHYHYQFEPTSRPLDQPPYKVMGPDPDAASFTTPPPSYPWELVTDRDGKVLPPLTGPEGGNAGFTIGGSKTAGFHADIGFGAQKKDFDAQFGGGGDWSKSTDYNTFINPTPALKQYEQTWAICRLTVNRSKGHVDVYGPHGYTGTAPWYADDIVTTDYQYFRPYAPNTVAPYVPGPGWTLPGY